MMSHVHCACNTIEQFEGVKIEYGGSTERTTIEITRKIFE